MKGISKNLGREGRLLRLIIALVLFGLAFARHSWFLFAGGVFVLLEAFLSWCIVYQILGINHCPTKRPKE